MVWIFLSRGEDFIVGILIVVGFMIICARWLYLDVLLGDEEVSTLSRVKYKKTEYGSGSRSNSKIKEIDKKPID